MGKKKRKPMLVDEMMESVERGQAYTINKHGEPAAMVLPWKDWQELNRKLRVLSDPTHDEPVYENDPPRTQAMMATQADEEEDLGKDYLDTMTKPVQLMPEEEERFDEELKARYGKTSQELADEAEAGYDVGTMRLRPLKPSERPSWAELRTRLRRPDRR